MHAIIFFFFLQIFFCLFHFSLNCSFSVFILLFFFLLKIFLYTKFQKKNYCQFLPNDGGRIAGYCERKKLPFSFSCSGQCLSVSVEWHPTNFSTLFSTINRNGAEKSKLLVFTDVDGLKLKSKRKHFKGSLMK